MATPPFNEDNLFKTLEKLNDESRVAFAASCCTRLMPTCSYAHLIDTDVLSSAVGMLWFYAQGREFHADDVTRAFDSCKEVARNLDQTDPVYAHLAQDACLAACNALDYLLSKDVKRIVNAASYARDAVDLFVQEQEDMDPQDPTLEERIWLHPLMQQELERQKYDLDLLTQDPKAISRLEADFKLTREHEQRSILDPP